MKGIVEYLTEATRFNWSKYDLEREDIDMRCEELHIKYSILPASKVKYSEDVRDYLLEFSDSVIEKPFDKEAKDLLKSFGVNPNNVEVFRHTTLEDFDNAEIIIYTPAGESTEGEDHDFAVEDIFPID